MGKYRPKKTMIAHRRFAEGGDVAADEPKWKKDIRESEERLAEAEKAKFAPPKVQPPSYWGEVKSRAKRLVNPGAEDLAPAAAGTLQDESKRMSEASGFKKGGKIKARGVGVAQRGHGKGRFV